MTKASAGALIVVFVVALIAVAVLSSTVGVWNKLNRNYQMVEGGKSHYSAALNTCTEKIKGVWEIANQYMEHESATFIAVAQARSGTWNRRSTKSRLPWMIGSSPSEGITHTADPPGRPSWAAS
jgi:hypothetical protein